MGERGDEVVARPGEKGNGERGGRKGLSALHSQRISPAHNIKHDTFKWVFPENKNKQTTGENRTLARTRLHIVRLNHVINPSLSFHFLCLNSFNRNFLSV